MYFHLSSAANARPLDMGSQGSMCVMVIPEDRLNNISKAKVMTHYL